MACQGNAPEPHRESVIESRGFPLAAVGQPEQDMRGLQCLMGDGEEVEADFLQVGGVPHAGGERRDYRLGVVASAVEPPVHRSLDAAAQRVEHRDGSQRRQGDSERRSQRHHSVGHSGQR